MGRENYRTWATAMRAYLQVEDLWDTVEAPADGALSQDPKKLQKARGRLILAVEPEIYTYIENTLTPKEAWDELSKTYDDQGLTRKVNLLQQATTTRLENCKSMEEYDSRIISATQKLSTVGSKIPDDIVGALLLTGLPSSYKLMVMALSNSGKDITADFMKTKLLEEAESDSIGTEFEVRGLRAQAQFSQRSHSNRGRYPPK